MNNNNYAIFYKSDENSNWHSKRLDLPFKQWDEYCKEQGYSEYQIKDLRTYKPFDLHLLTNVVLFNGIYYLPDETIPYPDYDTETIEKFDVSMEWEDEEEFYEGDYDEVYNGIEQLWTDINTKFSVNEDMDDLGIVAQIFVIDLPKFLDNLENNKHAVYINEEYSKFKLLAWIKDNKVRLIHQDYRFDEVKTEFDVIMDKNLFFTTCKTMILKMQEYADRDFERYNKYIKKYKK